MPGHKAQSSSRYGSDPAHAVSVRIAGGAQTVRSSRIWELWRERLVEAVRHAQSEAAHEEALTAERIHSIRRSIKIARSLLRIAPASLGVDAREQRRDLGEAALRLGAARDAQAMHNALKTIDNSGKRYVRSVASALPDRPLAEDEKRQAQQAVAEHLAGCAETISRWNLTFAPSEEFPNLLAASYRNARRKGRKKLKNASADELHTLRTRAIALQGQIAFTRQSVPDLTKPLAKLEKRLEKLRNRLGEHHDLEILRLHLVEHPSAAISIKDQRRVLHAIAEKQANRQKKVEKAVYRLFSQKPKRLRTRIAKSLLGDGRNQPASENRVSELIASHARRDA